VKPCRWWRLPLLALFGVVVGCGADGGRIDRPGDPDDGGRGDETWDASSDDASSEPKPDTAIDGGSDVPDGGPGRCGDGIVQNDEACDERPTPDGTRCSDDCKVNFEGLMLAAGNHHTCGLRRNGSLRCWGANAFSGEPFGRTFRYIGAYESWASGVLEDGAPLFWGSYTGQLPGSGPFEKLEPEADAYCAIDRNGLIHCSGLEGSGPPSGKFTQISLSSGSACGLSAEDRIFCWGRPEPQNPWEGTYRAVARGNTTCAIRSDRTLTCTGEWAPPAGEFNALTAGFGFQCAIRTNGEVECWGLLNGRGSASERLDPPSGKFALIDAGWQHVCGVRTDAVTVCWGANEAGQATAPSDFP